MIIYLSDLRELDLDARRRNQHRAGRMVNDAARATRGHHNQFRRHLVCDAQDDLRRVALRRQLTRRDDAARSQNGVRPRKYALTLYAAFKSLRFARPLEIRVPLFIRPRTRMQEKKLGVARRHFHRDVERACIAVRPAERNEDVKRFSRDRIHFCLCHNHTPLQAITRSSRRAISDLGCAPTMRSTSRPASSTSRVGMLRAWKRAAVAGFSSTFSFATRTRPASSAASSSITGSIIRHGPHHGAHMSSSTGRGERSTSASNVSAVAVDGLPPAGRGVLHRPQTGSSPCSIFSRGTRLLAPQAGQRINCVSDISIHRLPSLAAFSTAAINVARSRGPSWRRPLMNKVGVPLTPLLAPLRKSSRIRLRYRPSRISRTNRGISRPTSAAYSTRS